MIQFEAWPPPDWTEVIVTWDSILTGPYSVQELYDWCGNYPGARYHVHGWQATEGFAFRFESPKDAMLFSIMFRDVVYENKKVRS